MEIILVFIIGTVFGSFFGLVIDRLPIDESITFPSSHCSVCYRALAPRDLIPIFSQLIAKSRCRYCAVRIPYWYALLEFSTGSLFVMIWLGVFSFSVGLMLVMSLVLSVFDVKHHAFPFSVWLAFGLIILLISDFKAFSLVFLCLAFLAMIYNLKIGSGDLLWLFLASVTLPVSLLPLVILIASISGIIFIIIKKQTEIAFIPHLSLAYLILIVFPQIQLP